MNSLRFATILTLTLSLAVLGFTAPRVHASSGCWDMTAKKWASNVFGWHLWEYDVGNTFCTDGNIITWHNNPWGTQSTCCGWSSDGHSEGYDDGGTGQTYIRVHGTAHFHIGIWYLQTNAYVDIYATEYGNGALSVH
jgi:hypothetical protein